MSRPPRGSRSQAAECGVLLLPIGAAAVAAGRWSVDATVVSVVLLALVPFSRALAGRLTVARHRERYERPLVLWSLVALPLGAYAMLRVPWLAAIAALYGALFAVNLSFARRRQADALANELVFVLECTLAVPVLVGVASAHHRSGTPPWSCMADPWTLAATLLCALALVAATLHLRSGTTTTR